MTFARAERANHAAAAHTVTDPKSDGFWTFSPIFFTGKEDLSLWNYLGGIQKDEPTGKLKNFSPLLGEFKCVQGFKFRTMGVDKFELPSKSPRVPYPWHEIKEAAENVERFRPADPVDPRGAKVDTGIPSALENNQGYEDWLKHGNRDPNHVAIYSKVYEIAMSRCTKYTVLPKLSEEVQTVIKGTGS